MWCIATEALAPAAQRVDREAISVESLALLASAYGGMKSVICREVLEIFAGACWATTFPYAQHLLALNVLAGARADGVPYRWWPKLSSGPAIAGYMTEPILHPTPVLRATRHARSWRLDGHIPFHGSWGLTQQALPAADAGSEILLLLITAAKPDGLYAVARPPLAVMDGALVVRLQFEVCRVAKADVVDVRPCAGFREQLAVQDANTRTDAFLERYRDLLEPATRYASATRCPGVTAEMS